MMKYVCSWLKLVILVVAFSIIYHTEVLAEDSLLVFAGAGMRVPLEEIGKVFEAKYGVPVAYDFEGSGTLANKIFAGQQPDVYIPGGTKWIEKLQEKGYISNHTQLTYHIPVIITPMGKEDIQGLQDLTNKNIRLVLGDYEAGELGAVGGKIFAKAGIDESALNVVSRGITVKQLVQWIELETADASIVWHADAIQSGKVRIVSIPEDVNTITIIPVCEMKNPPHSEQAAQYVEFLLGEGKTIFQKHGFVTER